MRKIRNLWRVGSTTCLMPHDHQEPVRTIAEPPKPVGKEPPTASRSARPTVEPDATLDAVDARHAHAASPANELSSARAALRYLKRSATNGLRELEASAEQTRDHIVVKIALEVSHASEALAETMVAVPRGHRPSLQAEADATVDALHRVRTWIVSRTPRADMVTTFDAALRELDPALRLLSVAPIGDRPRPALKESEATEGTLEHAAVVEAAKKLENMIDSENGMRISGVQTFGDAAKLDDRAPPSFVEAVARSLVIAVTGHVFGAAMGAMLQRISHGTGRVVADQTKEHFVNVQTDTFQAFAGELSGASAAAEATTGAKARIYFMEALRQAAIFDTRLRKDAVAGLVASNRASVKTLADEAAGIADRQTAGKAMYAQTAAKLWALYQAQSTLGTHPAVPGKPPVSRMDDYFGVPNAAGDREVGTGRQGARGVARLGFDVSSGTTDLQPAGYEITGSSHEVASLVAAGAGHQLDKIELPKEITVYVGHYRAVIAIDETNRVRDSLGWDDLARAAGGGERTLASPHQFWAAVRTSRVS